MAATEENPPPPAQESRSQPQKVSPSERRGQERPPAIAAPLSCLLRPGPLSGRRGEEADGRRAHAPTSRVSPPPFFPLPASIAADRAAKVGTTPSAVAGAFSLPRRRVRPDFLRRLSEPSRRGGGSLGFHRASTLVHSPCQRPRLGRRRAQGGRLKSILQSDEPEKATKDDGALAPRALRPSLYAPRPSPVALGSTASSAA